jgi:hypothetical protein
MKDRIDATPTTVGEIMQKEIDTVSFNQIVKITKMFESDRIITDIKEELNKGFQHAFVNRGIIPAEGVLLDSLLKVLPEKDLNNIIDSLAQFITKHKLETDAKTYKFIKSLENKNEDLKLEIKNLQKNIENLTNILED